jgi:hypothetical protein
MQRQRGTSSHDPRTTAPYGLDGSKDQEIIDLTEVRRRLQAQKEPTAQDFLDALALHGVHAESMERRVGQVERDLIAMDRHFGANVAEVVKPLITKALNEARYWRHLALLAFGVLVVGVFAVAAIFMASSTRTDLRSLRHDLSAKANQSQVEAISRELETKADKAEVSKRLLAVELKADKSVVEQLARELQDADKDQGERVNDLATTLLSKADKAEVGKIASRLRATRYKLDRLERRFQDTQDAIKGQPDSLTVPDSSHLLKPHTM